MLLETGTGHLRGHAGHIRAAHVFVVPLFLGEGYFTRQVIPRELGLSDGKADDFPRVQNRNGRTLLYCDPPGTHESMAAAVLSRARNVVMPVFPFPRAPQPSETSLFIAAHGTSGNENSRKAAETQAERIRALGLYADVHAVFLEEEPPWCPTAMIWSTARAAHCGGPLFCQRRAPLPGGYSRDAGGNGGKHAGADAGRATDVAESFGKKGRLVWYAPSIGSEPGLADVILERVRETAARNP